MDHDRHMHIYISREISIEHPSVGLASLAQLFDMTSEEDVYDKTYQLALWYYFSMNNGFFQVEESTSMTYSSCHNKGLRDIIKVPF